jgi:hypothetical protein
VHPEALKQIRGARNANGWAAQPELGRVRKAGCSQDAFRIHGVRQGCQRSMPGLARTSFDSAMECSGPAAGVGTEE